MGWYCTRCYTDLGTYSNKSRIIYVFWSNSLFINKFAGVGIQNVVVLPNGNRINVAIGNTAVGLITTVPVTGKQLNLATNTVDVISWIPIDPNATGVWVPIDPNNP
tara:strand:+ start:84 stop:401 length:318 start_codon:yes stop_codon:yes gene_type:complete